MSTAAVQLSQPSLAEQAIDSSVRRAALLAQPTINVSELAIVVGVGKNAAYRLVREGRVRSLKIGRRIIIPTSAVRELLG